MQYQYPLKLSFKIIAMGPQIYVRDASEKEIFYVHQKAFKLKEDIGIFTDSSKSTQVFRITADRVIDFSAKYTFTDSNNMTLGAIKREGMKSLWKATYNIFDGGEQPTYHISEDKPFVKVMDGLFSEIPIVGMFAGYVFNPSYTLYQVGTETAMYQLTKQPAFFESSFIITPQTEIADPATENRLLLGLLMMILLERARG